MNVVNFKNEFAEYFLDEKRSISKKHLEHICQINTGEACRYISAISKKHFVCIKNSPIQPMVDKWVKEGSIGALNDNCDGLIKKVEK